MWIPSPAQTHKTGLCAHVRTACAYRTPCKSPTSKRAFVYVWTLCESKVLCMFRTEIWILASFFQPVLYLIFLTSLGTQQSSNTALALCNLSLRASPNHKTSCAPMCSPYAEKIVWKIGLCLEACGLGHHCHCAGVVFKINGCMLTRFDMLYKGRHLWSHDTAKQKTQQASLAKMSDMNKSTTICHIVVTKC